MNFINPIEILELQKYEISEIDNIVIKKAKRKVLAEIELSDDGHLSYKGHKINRSEIDKAINELDNKELVEFYHFIANNSELNYFLTTGNESIFLSFKQESIYKLPNFVNFISPYFAQSYDKALYKSFRSNNEVLFQKIISIKPLVRESEFETCYKRVLYSLKEIIKEIDSITTTVKNSEINFDENNIEDAFEITRSKLNVNIINHLPLQFQSIRNKCANSIRNLSVNIFNSYDNSNLALDIISYALEIDTDGLTEKNLTNDYEQIYNINSEREEQELNAPILKKYATLMIEIKSILGKLEKREYEIRNHNIFISDKEKIEFFQLIKKTGAELNIENIETKTEICEYISKKLEIEKLNSINEQFNEIKNQIALGLNALSVSIWNNCKNIYASQFIITKAFSIIGVSDETSRKLIESKNKINEIKRQLISNTKSESELKTNYNSDKNTVAGEPIQITPRLYTYNGIGTQIYKDTIYFVFLSIRLLPLKRYSVDNMGKFYRFYGELELHFWQKIWKYGIIVTIFILFIFGIGKLADSGSSNSNNSKQNIKSNNTSNSNNSKTLDNTSSTNNNKTFDKTSSSTNKSEELKNNKFKGNQLKNGDSPLDNCFGKSKYGGPSFITFKNNNESDAIVCLVDVNSGKTIRNEYIRKGMNYKMNSVPTGTYYLKYVSGNDWNPNLENFCGSKGNFQSDVNYSKSDNSSDYIKVVNTGRKYSYFDITLYSVAFGNMSHESMSESEFFK